MGESRRHDRTALNANLGESIVRYLKRFAHAHAELGDPPSIRQTHFLSTSMRRLMSAAWAYETFYGQGLLPLKKMGFKVARKALGRLRDAQVMQESFARLDVTACPYGERVLRHLREGERVATTAFLEKLRRMDFAPVARLRKRMPDAVLAMHPTVTLPEVRRRLLGEVLVLLPEAMTDDDALHGMRVRFKYYRYCNELLAPLIPGMDAGRLADLKGLQDVMGAAHDAAVLHGALALLDPGSDPEGGESVRRAAERASLEAHARAREVVAPALRRMAEAEGLSIPDGSGGLARGATDTLAEA